MGKKGVRGNIGADTDAIIRESDLIEFDGTFGQFAKLLKGTQKDIEDFMNALSNYAPKIRQNLQSMMQTGNMQLADSDKLRLAAQLIDQMYNAQMKLAASSTETAKTIALANEATSKNVQANKLLAEQTLAANGSIDQLNAKIKELTNQWTALSDAERQGAQGQQLIKQIANETLAIKRLNSAVRDEISTQMKLDSVTKQRNAAMSTEMKQVSAVRQELNALNRQRELEIKAANAADGSYEKLAASYELGKLKLKGMAHQTQDQINLFEAESQKLATLYKQMMDMQEATGKHTLSVGDYGKAFRSLSTETGMLVRELPSLAVSANTFFLAISNNLPMFMSAVSRMKKENQALAAQGLATTSVFKTVMKSILSWQTLVIVALSLLSKYGSKVVDWLIKISSSAKQALADARQNTAEISSVIASAGKKYAENAAEVEIIVKKLQDIKKGTGAWYSNISRLNEITKANIDANTTNLSIINQITEAYKEQAIQLALNEAILEKFKEDRLTQASLVAAGTPVASNDQGLFTILPKDYIKNGKKVELTDDDKEYLIKLNDAANEYWNDYLGHKYTGITNNTKYGSGYFNLQFTVDNPEALPSIEELSKQVSTGQWSKAIEYLSQSSNNLADALDNVNEAYFVADSYVPEGGLVSWETLVNNVYTAETAYKNISKAARNYLGIKDDRLLLVLSAVARQVREMQKYWPKMLDQTDKTLTNMFNATANKLNGGGQRTYSRQFTFDPWYEAKKSAEALAEKGATEAETVELWEKKKLAIELAAYGESQDKRRKYWDDQQKKLEADLKHGLITKQQYTEWEKAIERQRQLDIEALERKHNQDMLDIQQEAIDKRTKLFLKHYEIETAKLEEQLKGLTDPEKAKQILNELNMMVSEIETARDTEGQSAESAEAYRKALEALQKQIASTTSAITKMNIEQVKANTHLQKFGRAASALGQKRNLTIASKNIDELSAAIKKLREQMAGLDPNATNFETDKAAIQKQIDAYISQMQTNLNRVDVSKLTSSDGDLITRMIESSIDAAQPEQLLSSLRNLGFGDVVNMYLAEAIGETNDPALVRAFTNALQDNEGDIEAAIASMEPGMQEKMREVLANVGMKAGDDLANVFKKAWNTTKQWFNQTIGYLKDLAQAYVDLAEAKAEAAAKATDAAQEEYDKEKALLEAGYANQVETKWAEYQEKKRIQEEAEADAKAAAARMEEIETAQQVMSLITSIANIFEVMTKLGPWGTAAAAAMSGVMLASFIAAKSKAAEAAKVQYGEGHAELIGGGTHASGHDSPLAYDNQGRERRVERGEVVGIFKSRAVREIGASRLIRNIDNINRGRYTELATRAIDRGSNLNMLAQSVETSHADLSKLESGVNKIARQGEKSTYTDSVGNLIIQTPYGKTTYIRR